MIMGDATSAPWRSTKAPSSDGRRRLNVHPPAVANLVRVAQARFS